MNYIQNIALKYIGFHPCNIELCRDSKDIKQGTIPK